jgi:hypothetical protein
MITADHADPFIRGVEIQEDPWAEPEPNYADLPEYRPGVMRLAALYIGGGIWGTFLGIMCWWSVEFVMTGQSAAIVALN